MESGEEDEVWVDIPRGEWGTLWAEMMELI